MEAVGGWAVQEPSFGNAESSTVSILLVQLETNGLGELPLLLVEGVEVIRRQFERRCNMQEICRAGAELGSRLPR